MLGAYMTFIDVLQNRDKKWRRPYWREYTHISFSSTGIMRRLYKNEATVEIDFQNDWLTCTDWQEYKEPKKEEQIKVWVGNGCMEFYLAKEPWDSQDTEATPEQLRSIRAALGIKE